ncbi:MAG: transglycosylase SLT domain-containing protein [Nitrospirae bacterium]|nr:transglycosylase SLT domain-containing protein [Nitrospirota bacterium]
MNIRYFLFLLLSFIFLFSANSYAENDTCTEPYQCLNHAMEVFKAGKTEEAIQLYKDISGRFEGKDQAVIGISSFMAGSLMSQSESESMLSESEGYLERAYSTYPLISDYALFTLAGVHEKQGDYYKAAEFYQKVFTTFPDSLLRKKSLIRAADLYLASGDIEYARGYYEEYLALFHKDKSAPDAVYGIAMSYIMEDNIPTAFTYLKKIWIEYPASRVAWHAKKVMDWLKKEGYTPPVSEYTEFFKRGESLYKTGLYEDAALEFKRFLSYRESFTSGMERDAYFKLSMAYYNARMLSEAEGALEFFMNNYPDDKRTGEVLYSLGRNYLREDKEAAFVKASKTYIRSFRDKEKRPEVMYRLGMYYAEKNGAEKKDIDTSFRYLDRIIREYPHSSYALDSRWAKGWLLYKEKKFPKAIKIFDSILNNGKENAANIPKTLYWKARVFETTGNGAGMGNTLCHLCNKYKGSFYCFIAEGKIDGKCAAVQGGFSNETSMSESLTKGQENQRDKNVPPILVETDRDRNVPPILIEMDRRCFPTPPAVFSSESLQTYSSTIDSKIKLLLYLGFKDEAVEEVRWIQPELKDEKDKEMALLLSSLLYQSEEYNSALSVLYTNFSKENVYSESEENPILWRLMYPDGYSTFVNKYAGENKLDPFLLFALIREESWFNNEAVSPSGAIGLMQVMPKTASAIKNGDSVERHTMFDPEFNISLGAKFFADLIKRFNGNIIYAIASYNAGPNAVTKWIKERAGFELDEFIEDIPYRETRDYVKKVFASYREYVRINIMFIMNP